MARIKKRGLDYFPLDTDFITHRTVRRLMKREGDGAVGILVWLFSCIYADKGYYLEVDDVLLEDIAADFYGFTDEDVRRVVEAAVDCGIFDAGLYERRHILTSAHIQQQFAFVKKKARESLIDPDLSLLTDGGEETEAPKEASVKTERMAAVSPAEGDISPATDPHSIAKQRTAEQSKENPLLFPLDGETERGQEEGPSAAPGRTGGRKLWTPEALERLVPPADGVKRNFRGLLENLRQFRIPPDEQYAIICRSNYGAIGHSVWRGFCVLRESGGKIRLPGRYLLSLKT